jgi:hypothetical protein
MFVLATLTGNEFVYNYSVFVRSERLTIVCNWYVHVLFKDEQRSGKVFLAQLCYADYFDSEEKFTSDLTTYTKKQFFEVNL